MKKRNIVILFAVVAAILFVSYGIMGSRKSEMQVCVEKCKNINRLARLKPAYSNMPAKSGGYAGPYVCECY